MSLIPVNLATEDELSETVLLRILAHLGLFAVGTSYRRGGFGYLKRNARGWNHAAKGIPFIILTDLDQYECPALLIGDWLGGARHPNLLFRVAVREVEAWLVADRRNLAQYLFVPEAILPPDADGLRDPKAALVNVARKSRSRTIRERHPKAGEYRETGSRL